jgi:hypothetical protein
VLGVDLPRVDLLEVNLREGKVTSHPWDEASLERVREHVRFSVRAMKAYCGIPRRTSPTRRTSSGPRTPASAGGGNFRGICRPELPPFAESASSLSETTG